MKWRNVQSYVAGLVLLLVMGGFAYGAIHSHDSVKARNSQAKQADLSRFGSSGKIVSVYADGGLWGYAVLENSDGARVKALVPEGTLPLVGDRWTLTTATDSLCSLIAVDKRL